MSNTNTNQPKPLSKVAVLIAAQRLMLMNGQTTTLEVKTALRKEGFFALQDDVSVSMSELATEENWAVGDNSHHKLYSGVAVQKLMEDSLAVMAAINNKTAKKVVVTPVNTPKAPVATIPSFNVKADGSIAKAAARPGDWETNSVIPNTPVMYFPASVNRDKARSLYAKATGTSRNDARARQVK